jgi:hypothetical protein
LEEEPAKAFRRMAHGSVSRNSEAFAWIAILQDILLGSKNLVVNYNLGFRLPRQIMGLPREQSAKVGFAATGS